MNIKEIYEIAVANVMSPDDDYLYRKVCRQYSSLFYTPLHEVYLLNPDEVLKQVYENMLEKMDEDDLDLAADKIINPEAYQDDADAFEAYARQLEEQERKRHQERLAKQSLGKAGKPAVPATSSPVTRKYDIGDEG